MTTLPLSYLLLVVTLFISLWSESHAKSNLLYSIESTIMVDNDNDQKQRHNPHNPPLSHLGDYVPHSHTNTKTNIKWPPGLVNQSLGEEKYLRFHKCLERGEAFAASYFITTKYLRKLKVKTLNFETGTSILAN